MIYAAGIGSRLKPLTDYKPKALIEVGGISMLEHVLMKLKSFSITDFVINVHHFSNQIIDYFETKNYYGLNIQISDETTELLNTGGGLKKAANFFKTGDDILLYNVDILSNININKLYEYHKARRAIATLAVRNRTTDRKLLFDNQYKLVGWKNSKTHEFIQTTTDNERTMEFAFSGIHIVDYKLLSLLPYQKIFSIIDAYLALAANYNIIAYPHDFDNWLDIGKPENLSLANKMYEKESLLIPK